VQTQIAELAFADPKDISTRVGTVVSHRLTRASNDAALVTSWLGTFDPIDSARTLILYRRVSSAFLAWLATKGLTLGDLTTDDLASWRDQLRGAPATRSNRLAVVKSLLSYAHTTGYLRFNVARGVRGPKVPVDVNARSLTEVEIGLMIQAATIALRVERSRKNPRCRFTKAALSRLYLARFLYYTACRVAEAVAVTWMDLHARPDGDFQLTVLGKGQKRRTFPLPGGFVEQLVKEFMPADEPRGAPIFGFGVRRAQTLIADLAKLAGIDRPVSPHWYRHAAATHALDRGAPIHVVQQTLGHASLATTSRYAHKRADGAARYLPRL
jgi:integrase/recombinase XerD